MDANEQIAYYQRHPPRCLAGFKAIPCELRGVFFDGHASPPIEATETIIEGGGHVNPVFLLACACGYDQHRVTGYNWRNPDYHNELVFLSPLTISCGHCGKSTELIDTDRHRYDAEIGAIVATARAEGTKGDYICNRCGPNLLQLCIRFEYPDDLFDSDDEGFRGREQDLFSWVTLIGKCHGCSRLLSVAEFECA
jgi:ribosomal protein L37E